MPGDWRDAYPNGARVRFWAFPPFGVHGHGTVTDHDRHIDRYLTVIDDAGRERVLGEDDRIEILDAPDAAPAGGR